MPAGDGTGPRGMGSRTGRGAGYCSGYAMPGYANPISGRGFGFGRGFGMGRGGGWGRRNWYYATGLTGWQRAGLGAGAYGAPPVQPIPYAGPAASGMSREQELNALRGQADYFEDALTGIKKRIEEVEARINEKDK